MRSHAKAFLFGLFLLMGLTWVGEASATFVPSGGSRLLFYFSKKSFAAGAANDTAQTLLFVTNTNNFVDSRVGIKYYRSDCVQEIGPVFQNIGAGRTLRIDVSAQAPAFQEGVAEAFFVNASNQPIRYDAGVGSSLIIDLVLVSLLRLPAALLHSDDRNGGGLIADNANFTSWAPLAVSGNFLEPAVVATRLAVFAPGTASGTTSPDKTVDVNFHREDGGGSATPVFDSLCGRSQTLAQVRGQTPAAFQAAYPNGGVVAPQISGQQKGLVGWLIEVVDIPEVASILFGQLLQGFATAGSSAHP